MFPDQTLLPKEAVRVAALGLLAGGPRTYAVLAGEVRHFIGRIIGPSLDLMSTSLELLRYEGLIEPVDGADGAEDRPLRITDAGLAELRGLLCSGLRTVSSDAGKLVMALKMRFLHLLARQDQQSQADLLIEAHETELARLVDLRAAHAQAEGPFLLWLEHDIAQLQETLDWFHGLRADL